MSGCAPVVLERGRSVTERTKDVERFWESGVLDTVSNVQFGEGGAGTFSDGKLNTLVKDPTGRNRFVLETFVKIRSAGADSVRKQTAHRNGYSCRSHQKHAAGDGSARRQVLLLRVV